MPLAVILTATVIPWLANQLYDAYKDKYVLPGIKKLLFPADDYISELGGAITVTIEKYQKLHPPSGNFPFYHHRETILELSKYVLFESDKHIFQQLNFDQMGAIDKPTFEEVDDFYSFFISEIKNNEKLKELYIEENYKEKIFRIYDEITLIKNIIEEFIRNIPSTDIVVKDWIERVNANLKELKNKTALEEINHFESEILPKYSVSDATKAFMYFVKGLCLNENLKSEEAIDYFGQACLLDPGNERYQTWYLYLQYLFRNSAEAFQKVKERLQSNAFDPILNGVLTMESMAKDNMFSPQLSSSPVRNNIRYKRIIYRYFLSKGLVSQAISFLETDTTDIEVELKKITIDNYSYLDFYLQTSFLKLLYSYPELLLFQFNKELKESEDLKKCIDYFSKYLEQIKDTEKVIQKTLYTFLHNLALFQSSEDKKYLDTAHQIFSDNKDSIAPFYFRFLKFGYSQIGNFSKAIDLFSEDRDVVEDSFFKSVLYERIGDEANSRKAIIEYINALNKVDRENISMVLNAILIIKDMTYLGDFYKKLTENHFSIDSIYKDILLSTRGLVDNSLKEQSVKMLEDNFQIIMSLKDESLDLINTYCKILFEYDLWTGIINILTKIETKNFLSDFLLIESYSKSNTNASELLKKLEEVRSGSYPQIEKFYLKEIQLNYLLAAWNNMEVISLQGIAKGFNLHILKYYLAIAYLNQLKSAEYCKTLSEMDLNKLAFAHFNILTKGLIELGKYKLAIEYIYIRAITLKEAEAKMLFFYTFLSTYEKIDLQVPLYCEVDFFVRIHGNDKTQVVNYQEHTHIFKNVIGKRIGESFNLLSSIIHKDIEYKIIGIQHKYEVLNEIINLESINPELSGLPIHSFQFQENGELEDWHKQLQDVFGKSSDERLEFAKNIFKQYEFNELTFIPFARTVFKGNLLKAYNSLTHPFGKGFKTIPHGLIVLNGDVVLSDRFCIDIPSLFCMVNLEKELEGLLTKCFVTSKYTKQYLEALIYELENDKSTGITLNITSENVIPIDHSLSDKEELAFLKKCITWIETYSEQLTSSKELDFLVKAVEDEEGISKLLLSYLETVTLADDLNLTLISDDGISWNSFKNSVNIIGIETYLLNKIDSNRVFDSLSEKNYIGIGIPNSRFNEIATSLLLGSERRNLFSNISFKRARNTNNIIAVVVLINELFDKPNSIKEKQKVIKKLLTAVFENITKEEEIFQMLFDLIVWNTLSTFKKDKDKIDLVAQELSAIRANS